MFMTLEKNLEDDFAVMKFWFGWKKQFPNLYVVAARVFARPVSSASSDRVFSVLNLFVGKKLSLLCSLLVDDMIVERSYYTRIMQYIELQSDRRFLNK